MRKEILLIAALACVSAAFAGQPSFVNWESPHVSPLEVTPDGSLLLAVNTADNRLEVFEITGFGIDHVGAVPVGLDPVTVRARTNSEAWVVNHVSDSISIVDLAAMNVVGTIYTDDEPADVVFAGDPERAFVTVSQRNQIKVYDPASPFDAPIVIDIEGEDPRALATDGNTVYAAIFESGNDTTVLNEQVVSSNLNPYGGNPNPPPNDGAGFDPPIAKGLPTPPGVSQILRKDAAGVWRDVNDADWSAAVTWDLHDHDVAIIDAGTLSVDYATGLMNANMAIAVRPGAGATVVGIDGINEVRFEPNVNGIFARVMGAVVNGPGDPASLVDLNGHLDYTTATISQRTRDQSIGDPRGIAWTAAGDRSYVTGMGSNNVVVFDGSLSRIDRIEVGEGPTGVRIDESNDRVYVLNKFEGSISVLDSVGLTEEARVGFFDPTPSAITEGRPFLYDTHRTSGLGQAACASCHIDGRMDQIGWDLGDPQGAVKPFNQVCNFGLGGCEDWHPMKGPMTTQTLIGIVGTEPFHWRGDRENLAAFNGAFESLMGDDTQLTGQEMDKFSAFVATLTSPPNPFRDYTSALPTDLDGANAQTGSDLFTTAGLDGINCGDCHALPSGTNGQLTSAGLLQESQSIKIPQLRNMHEKTGFNESGVNNRGFGYIHDGSVFTLFNFLEFPAFTFDNNQERRDVDAFLMSFATDTHAGVGVQATLPDKAADGQPASASDLVTLAAGGNVGLVAKGVIAGEPRGWYLLDAATFQSDRAAETEAVGDLMAAAGPGEEITFTVVPAGAEVRIGVDRDEDGYFDGDEADFGSDPMDPDSNPAAFGDINGDGQIGTADLLLLLAAWGPCADCENCPPDLDGDCQVSTSDLLTLLSHWTG